VTICLKREREREREQTTMEAVEKKKGNSIRNNKKKKQKKESQQHRPFRIRTGCVVALRHSKIIQQLSNNDKDTTITWVSPPPFGGDQTNALCLLLGRTLRCQYPEPSSSNNDTANNNANKEEEGNGNNNNGEPKKKKTIKKKKKTKVLEGEVVVLHSSTDQFACVDLLLSPSQLPLPDGIVPIEDDDDSNAGMKSPKKRQQLEYEHRIRGKFTIIVRIYLTWPSSCNSNNSSSQNIQLCHKWVIQTKTNGSGNFVGNHIDKEKQQVANGRWVAQQRLLSSSEQSSALYRVERVILTNSSSNNDSNTASEKQKNNNSSLANVVLQRIFVMGSKDGTPSVFCTTSSKNQKNNPCFILEYGDDTETAATNTLTVPIENVVMACRKIIPLEAEEEIATLPSRYNNRTAILVGRYYPSRTSWTLLRNGGSHQEMTTKNNETPSVECCHRCRRENVDLVPDIYTTANNHTIIKSCRSFYSTVLRRRKEHNQEVLYYCQCLKCQEGYADARHTAFRQQVIVKESDGSNQNEDVSDNKTTNVMVAAEDDTRNNTCTVCFFNNNNKSSSAAANADLKNNNTSMMHKSCTDWSLNVKKIQKERRRLQQLWEEQEKEDATASTNNGDSSSSSSSSPPSNSMTTMKNNGSDDCINAVVSSSLPIVDFDLPSAKFSNWKNDLLLSSSDKPITTPPKRKRKTTTPTKRKKRAKKANTTTMNNGNHQTSNTDMNATQAQRKQQLYQREEKEDTTIFKPTCSRLLPYNAALREFNLQHQALIRSNGIINNTYLPKERPRIHRQDTQLLTESAFAKATSSVSNTNSRAARANQRRVKRALPPSFEQQHDALSGRQNSHLLRFDQSKVHAWGVFSDSFVAKGDFVIEYRGELIGNAVAEKREAEVYSKKDVDYMFRVDPYTVCDATRLGNVARFINASCEPNCVAQIITTDGTLVNNYNKRIVIYAKQDIAAGEELCYDYKFPMEYDDPSKRIPCRCGAPSCRGYMNWDKKFDGKQQKMNAAVVEKKQHDGALLLREGEKTGELTPKEDTKKLSNGTTARGSNLKRTA